MTFTSKIFFTTYNRLRHIDIVLGTPLYST